MTNKKNLCFLFLALVLILSPPGHTGTVIVTPGFVTPASPTVTLSPMDAVYDADVYTTIAGCMIAIMVSIPDPKYPNNVRYHQYTKKHEYPTYYGVVDGVRAYTCMGGLFYDSRRPEHVQSNLATWKSILEGITVNLAYADGSVNASFWFPASSTCRVQAQLGIGGRGYFLLAGGGYTKNSCFSKPVTQPAECKASVPATIDHGKHVIDSGTSRRATDLSIECTKTASVDIDVQKTVLPLPDGNNVLPSQLYVGHEGMQVARVTASPGVSVPLISIIDTTGAKPGTYQGSRVIIVSWD